MSERADISRGIDVLLKGFGFSGYRSFGNDLVKIAPLRKVNFIIGQNNTGKSNIINFLKQQYAFFTLKATGQVNFDRQQENPFKDIDRHISNEQIVHKIAFPLLRGEVDEYLTKILKSEQGSYYHDLAKKILTSGYLCDEEHVWFVYKSNSLSDEFKLDVDINAITDLLNEREWQGLWNHSTKRTGGRLKNWINETISHLSDVPSSSHNIELIPAIRKIGQSGSKALDFSGEGIIERLAKIQNPPYTSQEDKEKFTAINRFVQNVLENFSANIEIPYARDTIHIHMDGKTLPLESLGTGVHEVIILAAASTILENTILCVEEPELHLHPLLQKKLVKYLSDETSNQYLFTTHSAHLLDAAVEAEIFHVTQKNGASYVEAISSTRKRSDICNDLGYKASDILQANCIIWVEGPSDRIYLNYWLVAKHKDFVEGIHYSIMFYGGRLFSHLTALDKDEEMEGIESFVSVRKLNRNAVIMFDSDKSSSTARISNTKQRLKQEFDQGPGFAWVTQGREVENYLNVEELEKAVLAVHPSAKRLIKKDKWSNLLEYEPNKRTEKKKTANKVKVAQHYTEHNPVDFSVLDLNEKLNSLVRFISISNGDET